MSWATYNKKHPKKKAATTKVLKEHTAPKKAKVNKPHRDKAKHKVTLHEAHHRNTTLRF